MLDATGKKVALETLELVHDGRTHSVGDGERCLIGRAQRCDVVLDLPSISREHAVVAVRRGRVTLTVKF